MYSNFNYVLHIFPRGEKLCRGGFTPLCPLVLGLLLCTSGYYPLRKDYLPHCVSTIMNVSWNLVPDSGHLTSFKVVWHEKMLFGMYLRVRYVLAFISGVGRRKGCLAFLSGFSLNFYHFFQLFGVYRSYMIYFTKHFDVCGPYEPGKPDITSEGSL